MTIDGLTTLDAARVDPRVWEVRSDYVVLLMGVKGIVGGPTDDSSDAALTAAEAAANQVLAGTAPEDLPEVQAWRSTFADLGVKPRVARSSIEALLRRCPTGLPRIDRLTDLYNAVSVHHLLPIGGEDLDAYDGPPRLAIADGGETFDTVANGQPTIDHAERGEVIWRDNAGVTCRRWNWRQCARTRLTPQSTRALFIFDGLGQNAGSRVDAAADLLASYLHAITPTALLTRRLITRHDDD